MEELRKRLILSVTLVLLIVCSGTVGYMAIEGWSVLDALYMTIITLTTVGYREVHPLSERGLVFTMIVLVGGVGTFFYVLTAAARTVVEGELQEVFGRKRLEKRIRELRDHYVICGYGRMGRIISRELKEKGVRFVVIEKSLETLQEREDVLAVTGDATNDHTLKEAGIERARGLISVLPTDAENLFVVLSARGLNPDLFIVARAVDEGAEQKLLRAGADKVVSPYHIGGIRMAYTVLRPAVVEFIEFATKTGNIELRMEEVSIGEDSKLVGMSLDECGFGRDLGIIIVAIKRATGDMKFNPTSRSSIKAGDTLIAIGEASKLKVLEDISAAKR